MKLTPSVIRQKLDEVVIGQDDAKKALSITGFLHYLRFASHNLQLNNIGEQPKKSNLLLLGSSGSGKTLLVRTMAQILNFPFLEIAANTITREGFHGSSIGETLDRYFKDLSRFSRESLLHGIVFIDEVDKLCHKVATTNYDDWNREIQCAILKYVEGFTEPSRKEGSIVDTHNLLFIFAGSFENLRRSRTEKSRKDMGFIHVDAADKEFVHDELIDIGIIPELAGRISMVAELEALTEAQLLDILENSSVSPVKAYVDLLEGFGYAVPLTREHLQEIARKCYNSKIGARALQAELDKLIGEALYEI
jgi:ATP-dependent Clp protease ATP-binding subunit ClpX